MKVDIEHSTMTVGGGWFSKGTEYPSIRVTIELSDTEWAVAKDLNLVYKYIVSPKNIKKVHEIIHANDHDVYDFSLDRCKKGHEAPFYTTEDVKCFEVELVENLKALKERIEANKGDREDKSIEL